MKIKVNPKIFSFFFTMIIFSVLSNAFIEANKLGSPIMMYFFLLVIALLISSAFPWYLKYPLELVAALLTCFYYFNYDLAFGFRWLRFFCQNTFGYLTPSFRGELTYLPENIALVIFLLGFIILINLVLVYQTVGLTYFFSISYLIILVISNRTDLTMEIIIVCVAGLGLAYSQNKLHLGENGYGIKDFVIMVIIGSVSLGAWYFPMIFPNRHQQVTDVSQNLKDMAQKSRWYELLTTDLRGGVSQLGFSENDEQLGGPVRVVKGLVFEVISERPHYWQVSSRNTYNGRGWQSSDTERNQVEESPFVVDNFLSGYKVASENISVTLKETERFVPKPSGRVEVNFSEETLTSGGVQYSPLEDRLFLEPSNLPSETRELELTYNAPQYTVADLQGSKSTYNFADRGLYLQLPDNLPQRVKDLAIEITESSTNDYERVKAIETYLKISGDFTYSLERARQLPSGRDYVDYFLFDYPVGYCEHFSTAMVVLVRSLGLPARWVKGFSEGEYSRKAEDGRNIYQVGNQNAHAWPEIYFSGIGWIPFEPTKSFNNNDQDELLASRSEEESEVSTTETVQSASDVRNNNSSEDTLENPKLNEGVNSTRDAKSQRRGYFFLVGILSISWGLLFWFRKQLCWQWLLFKVKYVPNYTFKQSFTQLLKLLQPIMPRENNQTLKEYCLRLLEFDRTWEESLLRVFKQMEIIEYSQEKQELRADIFLNEYQRISQVILNIEKEEKS